MRVGALVPTLEHEGRECARLALISRADNGVMDSYLRGNMAGLAQALRIVTGEQIPDIEDRWVKASSTHFTVENAENRARANQKTTV